MTRTREDRPAPAGVDTNPKVLSPRELETAIGIARGKSNREIAAALGISTKTIDTHRGHLLRKLGVRLNADVAAWAINWGLVVPPRVRDLLGAARRVICEVGDPLTGSLAHSTIADVDDYLALVRQEGA